MAADGTAAALALVADWTSLARRLAVGLAQHEEGASLFVTGLPIPLLNPVIPWRLDVESGAVERLLDLAAARGVRHELELRPGAAPALAELARSRGMEPGDQVPLMVLDAGDLSSDPPGDLVIRELAPEEADLHARVAAAGFEVDPRLFAALVPPVVLEASEAHAYVGETGGEVVTTALAFSQRGHVGIYNVGTPPAHRGRGYGAAITAHAAAQGFREGAGFAYLQASPMGLPVYERLGFRIVETWSCWTA